MIQRQLKLKLTKSQEKTLDEWLISLSAVWNFAIRKIELDSKDHIYYSSKTFQNILSGTSKKIDIPSHVLQGVLLNAYIAWQKCFKKTAKKPKLKGFRNKLRSISFPDPIDTPANNKIKIPGLGKVKYCKQDIPKETIKFSRIIKKASGWYLSLCIDTEPNKIPIVSNGKIGIDPGFISLITLSTGEKIEHPKELEKSLTRLGQAQRGINKKLIARINEHIANQRKDRNHKLSRRLVSENELIVFSKGNLKELSRIGFGKSVQSAGHGQLRQMLNYKCTTSGRRYLEVPGRGSTMTCSTCGSLTGPIGKAGLKVRHWNCKNCGAFHDRDINAAINTLNAGAGIALERIV